MRLVLKREHYNIAVRRALKPYYMGSDETKLGKVTRFEAVIVWGTRFFRVPLEKMGNIYELVVISNKEADERAAKEEKANGAD